MKALVVYASQTGNTKNLAETVCTALPAGTLLCTVDEAPDQRSLISWPWDSGLRPESRNQNRQLF